MATRISPLAGKPAPPSLLVDVPKLVTAYYTEVPDPSVPAQRVAFGTSGHRGSAARSTKFRSASSGSSPVCSISRSASAVRKAATFLRRDGAVWTTDKDGIVPALLATEITARSGRDPGTLYTERAHEFGDPVADRVEAPATPEQKKQLAALTPQHIEAAELGGERITTILANAPGNGAPFGGVKVIAQSGWFAARPSGTEDIYKIYAESFSGEDHLRILSEAQAIVDRAISPSARALPPFAAGQGRA